MNFPVARFAAKWFRKYYIEQLVFFITARCNLKCNMCFYYEEIDAASKARELTLEEIQKVAKSMWPFYQLNIGGGEPFLRKDIADICGAFVEHAKVRQIVIPTNGWYTDNVVQNVKRIVTENPDVSMILVLSVDGMKEQHDHIRGQKGSYDHLIETYRALLPLRAEHKNLSLLTNTTLSRDNETQIVDILQHLDAEYDFNDHILTLVRFKSRDENALNVSIDNYKRGIHFILERKIRKSSYPGLPKWIGKALLIKDITRYRVILDLVEGKKFTTPCYAGQLAVTMNEEGRIAECEVRQTEIGKLRDVDLDFNKLYFSKKREEVAQKQLDEKCACTYECYIPFNVLLHPMSLPRMMKAAMMTFVTGNPEAYVLGGARPPQETQPARRRLAMAPPNPPPSRL